LQLISGNKFVTMIVMTTRTRTRVNLSLDAEELQKLTFFSDLKDQPLAAQALEYIKQGLELDEDRYWSEFAEQRYDEWVKGGKKSYSLEEVWKKHIGSDFPKEFSTKTSKK